MKGELIDALAMADPGHAPEGAVRLAGGEVGRVWRVELDGSYFVVKLTAANKESPYAREPVCDRVYGSRWSNLLPAYERLTSAGVPVPTLFASGALVGRRLNFEILEWLDGDQDDHSTGWFEAAGGALGALHRTTREHQGWVGMRQPYPEPWPAAFARSYASRLEAAAPALPAPLHRALERLAAEDLSALGAPSDYVLSHTDGLQGVFSKRAGDWRLLGLVDIEDHQFTDQRFVLAGFELGEAFDGRTAPASFWRAYEAFRPVDPSYERFRRLFQSYYLLVWTVVFAHRPQQREACLRLLEARAA